MQLKQLLLNIFASRLRVRYNFISYTLINILMSVKNVYIKQRRLFLDLKSRGFKLSTNDFQTRFDLLKNLLYSKIIQNYL